MAPCSSAPNAESGGRAYDDAAVARLAEEQECAEVNASTVHVRAAVADLAPGMLDPWLARREEEDRQGSRQGVRPGIGLMLDLALRPERALVRLRDMADGIVLSGEGAVDLNGTEVQTTSESVELWRNPVTLWRYERPATGAGLRPAFLHLHGDGWFAGRPTGRDPFLRYLAGRSETVVFDLDYSLAPEFKFPHALNEAHAALRHLHDHAATYGIDPGRIVVGGGSAGGNLTAATALKARAEGGPQMALQVLMNPVVLLGRERPPGLTWRSSDFIVADDARKSVGALRDPARSRALRGMFRAYIGKTDPGEPLLSPALAPELHGLPPALICTAEFDVLRPQAEHFAGQLVRAGVRVCTIRYRGIKHDTPALFGDVPAPEGMALEVLKAIEQRFVD